MLVCPEHTLHVSSTIKQLCGSDKDNQTSGDQMTSCVRALGSLGMPGLPTRAVSSALLERPKAKQGFGGT